MGRPLPRRLAPSTQASFDRKVDAQRFAHSVEADLIRGHWIDPDRGRELFGDWADCGSPRRRTASRRLGESLDQSIVHLHLDRDSERRRSQRSTTRRCWRSCRSCSPAVWPPRPCGTFAPLRCDRVPVVRMPRCHGPVCKHVAIERVHEFDLHAELGTTFVPVGLVRRVLGWLSPVDGGWARGERINGTVFGPGADWVTIGPDGYGRIDVRLQVLTDYGAVLYVTYAGVLEMTDALAPRRWATAAPTSATSTSEPRPVSRPATTGTPGLTRNLRRPGQDHRLRRRVRSLPSRLTSHQGQVTDPARAVTQGRRRAGFQSRSQRRGLSVGESLHRPRRRHGHRVESIIRRSFAHHIEVRFGNRVGSCSTDRLRNRNGRWPQALDDRHSRTGRVSAGSESVRRSSGRTKLAPFDRSVVRP